MVNLEKWNSIYINVLKMVLGRWLLSCRVLIRFRCGTMGLRALGERELGFRLGPTTIITFFTFAFLLPLAKLGFEREK